MADQKVPLGSLGHLSRVSLHDTRARIPRIGSGAHDEWEIDGALGGQPTTRGNRKQESRRTKVLSSTHILVRTSSGKVSATW